MEKLSPEMVNETMDKSPTVRKRKAKANGIKKLFLDYLENSTLHGLKYTTVKGIHLAERIFWVVTFLLSLGMCLWLIHKVWHKWETSPVIVSFSEKIVPVEKVPFPSLTICPQIKAKTTVYNYTKHFKKYFADGVDPDENNTTDDSDYSTTSDDTENLKMFLDVSLICPLPFYVPTYDFETLPGPNVTNASTIDTILNVSPSLEYFQECTWLGRKKRCSRLFSKVLTEEGVCFNFNGLAASEIFRMDKNGIQRDYNYSDIQKESFGWNSSFGYDNSDDIDYLKQYPHRGQYSRHRPYLEVYLMTHKADYDEYCNVINKGYKVYIQDPTSHPQSSVYSYAILPGQSSAMALKVNMMNTSEKLLNYDAETRQCFFSSEKYLRYFKLYTASNCLLECMSNYSYEICKCVSFHMPYTDSRSICTLQQADCLREAGGANRKLTDFISECDCLPNCNSITYEAEILKTEFNLEKSVVNYFKMIEVDGVADYFRSYEYSKLEVYYRDSGFVTITRSELFGITDFLANIGGLLGLFMGFSFLSLVEIVYFFSIRLGYTLRKDIEQEKDADLKSTSATIDVEDVNEPTKMKY
ncbi:pickpocket protein 28-like [Plodia interpunctella]|uniref:pickpocket protein 28-like n=1 Tax=Plodia interpunctella TaxID=58824 RepID=UPI002368DA7A|nr:pickpocket protein 28-like [Plodia interpunctella]